VSGGAATLATTQRVRDVGDGDLGSLWIAGNACYVPRDAAARAVGNSRSSATAIR